MSLELDSPWLELDSASLLSLEDASLELLAGTDEVLEESSLLAALLSLELLTTELDSDEDDSLALLSDELLTLAEDSLELLLETLDSDDDTSLELLETELLWLDEESLESELELTTELLELETDELLEDDSDELDCTLLELDDKGTASGIAVILPMLINSIRVG